MIVTTNVEEEGAHDEDGQVECGRVQSVAIGQTKATPGEGAVGGNLVHLGSGEVLVGRERERERLALIN